MREHEHSPLVLVQGWSDVPRGRPLFESLLVFENYPVDASLAERAGGLGIEAGRILEQTNFPLTLMVAPGDELLLRADYDADASTWTPSTAAGHLRNVLEGIAADPSRDARRPVDAGADEQEHLLRLARHGPRRTGPDRAGDGPEKDLDFAPPTRNWTTARPAAEGRDDIQ
jgi:non-ribosomal peptide synthetase component F